MINKKFLLLSVFFLGIFTFPLILGATHSVQTDMREVSAFRAGPLVCGDIVDGSVTYNDEPYRLLKLVSAGGQVARDDTWLANITVNGSTNQLYSFGNCACGTGCSSSDLVTWFTLFQDSGATSPDFVTITGRAKETTIGTDAKFSGYLTFASWDLCDAKQVTNNGACRTTNGSINTDKTSCGAPCTPSLSWSTQFAESVTVKKNGTVLFQGTPQSSGTLDALLAPGTYVYTLHGTASDGNNSPKEFELGSVTVNVSSVQVSCDNTSTSINTTVTIQGHGYSPLSWTAPGGTPPSGSGDSFPTSYSTSGTKIVTVSGGGSSGTCTVNVGTTIDIKANSQDSLTLPNTASSFALSWSPVPPVGNLSNCRSSGDWSNTSRPSSGTVQIATANVAGTKTYVISCTDENGQTTSDSVSVTVSPPPQAQQTCDLSASSNSINSGDQVSFTVTSSPSGYSYYWTGTDNNVNIGQVNGTGNTNRVETYKFNKPGTTYTRKAHVQFPTLTCDTQTVTVTVASSGGGGDGGNQHYYGCVNEQCTELPQSDSRVQWSSLGVCQQQCEHRGSQQPEPPPPPPTPGVLLKAATDYGDLYQTICTDPDDPGSTVSCQLLTPGTWQSPLIGPAPINGVDLWAQPNTQAVYSAVQGYWFDCQSDGTIEADAGAIPWWRFGNGQSYVRNLCNYSTPGTYTATAVAYGGEFCSYSRNFCVELGRGTVQIQATPPPEQFNIDDIVWSIRSGTPRYRADYDYDNNSSLDIIDRNTLLAVSTGLNACPNNKTCDINNSGAINASDVLAYSTYLQTYDVYSGTNEADNARASLAMSSSAGATVALTVNSGPTGSSVSPASLVIPANGSGSAELRMPSSLAIGNYSPSIVGTAGGGTTRTSNAITLRVLSVIASPPSPDFNLNKNRDIFVNIIGTQAITSNVSTITVNVFDGFSSNVNLSVNSINPVLAGATYNFTDSSLSPSEFSVGSDFSVTVPPNTPAGVYTITVRGIDGGLVRDINVRLNVNTKDPSFKEI